MVTLFIVCIRHSLRSVVAVIALPLAMLVAGTFTPPFIHAAGGTASFNLQPAVYDPSNPVTQSYFVLNLSPGTTTTLGIRVINSGTATGTVSLYSEDATTAQSGGIVFNVHGTPLRDVGSWISLNTQSLTLAAGQSKVVLFKLAIPRVVRPGQHLGGIIAEELNEATATTKNQHFQINVQHIFGMAVQVNLPGSTTEQLIATAIQAGGANDYQTLLVGLKNTGTMMVDGSGSLQVTDTQGKLLQNLPIHLGIFLPQTATNCPVYVQKKALGAGTYQAVLTLNYGRNNVFDHVLHYTTTFTITEQQVKQVFQPSGPLQAPDTGSDFFGSLPLWQIVLIGLLLVSGALFLGQNLYRLAAASLGRRKNNSHQRGKNNTRK